MMDEHHDGDSMPTEAHNGVTRREFAVLSGAALLASLIPIGLTPGGAFAAALPHIDGSLVSEHEETLADGARRTTQVIEIRGLPTKQPGVSSQGRQSVVMTRRNTDSGDVIEYEISAKPAIEGYDGRNYGRFVARYEFTHGAVQGDMREDEVRITGQIGDTVIPPTQRRVLRPVNSVFKTMTSEEKLRLGIALANKHGAGFGHKEHIPGAMIVLDGEK